MKISLNSFMVRTGIILFWMTVIFAFLYMPLALRFFGERKSISLFIWPMILDARVLAQFEQETGVKVYVNYYETNEELYSKLKATKGAGYDLIVPTDYMVQTLIQDGILEKLDYSKMPFASFIKPQLKGHYFDPANEYSLPYYTCVFGLGINKELINIQKEPGWSLVFEQPTPPLDQLLSISMLDSAREAIMLAGFYLYKNIDDIKSPEALDAITQLLIKQKKWVSVYTSTRVEELLASGSCSVAVGTSPDVWKVTREYPHIGFVVPHEGSFVTIDSCVIPKASGNKELVYQLLNFLYQSDVIQHNSIRYGFCSPRTDMKTESGIYCPEAHDFKKLQFFKNVLSKQQIQDAWIAIKAR